MTPHCAAAALFKLRGVKCWPSHTACNTGERNSTCIKAEAAGCCCRWYHKSAQLTPGCSGKQGLGQSCTRCNPLVRTNDCSQAKTTHGQTRTTHWAADGSSLCVQEAHMARDTFRQQVPTYTNNRQQCMLGLLRLHVSLDLFEVCNQRRHI